MLRRLVFTALIPITIFALAQEGISTRAIFMSTAGSTVSTDKPQETKSAKQTKVAKEKDYSNQQTLKQLIPAGLSVEVLKISSMDGLLSHVDPSKYRFKTGDKFIVKFQTNLPGYVGVYNITPDRRVNRLGIYQVPAFLNVQLPAEGEFQFINKKGEEKLVFVFIPCKPESRAVSRDIITVSSQNNYGNVSDSYVENLPSCNVRENDEIEYESPSGRVTTASRDIINTASYSTIDSKYESGNIYTIKKMDFGNIKPVVAVLRFIHE